MKPVPVNNSPDLTMVEITKQLLNNKFLSDIQFSVGNRIIYAHSLELMKRSRVFEAQLAATWTVNKLIPIDVVKYESFYQFLRFIYTDECGLDNANCFDLLRLALTYKVIKLENKVVGHLLCGASDMSLLLNFFEFCVEENYEIPLERVTFIIAANYKHVLLSPSFETIKPSTLESILKMDTIQRGVAEIQILKGLLRWIKRFCAAQNFKVFAHENEFQKYINLIRFSAITNKDTSECIRADANLFADGEIVVFFKKIIHKNVGKSRNTLGISKARKFLTGRFRPLVFPGNPFFITTFSVSKDLVLTGIVLGGNLEYPNILLEIASSNKVENGLKFNFMQQKTFGNCCISLGESIVLEPGLVYTITVTILAEGVESSRILCHNRVTGIMLIGSDFSEFVNILEYGRNMFQLLFENL